MTNKLDNGFSDGEVLNAADLNDTFDGVKNLIDEAEKETRVLSSEILENRFRNTKLEIVTNSDAADDRENLLTEFLIDQDGFQNTVTTSDALYVTPGNQFNNHYTFSVDNNYSTVSKSFSTGVSGVASAYDQESEHVAVVTSSTGSNASSGEDGTWNASFEVYDQNSNLVSSGSVSATDFELTQEANTKAFYTGENTLVIIAVCDNVDSEDHTFCAASVDTTTGSETGSLVAFSGGSLEVDAVGYRTGGAGEIFVRGDEAYILVSGELNKTEQLLYQSFGFEAEIVGVSGNQCFTAQFGQRLNHTFAVLSDGIVDYEDIDTQDNNNTNEDEGFIGDSYYYRGFDVNDYVGVDVSGPFLVDRPSEDIGGITDSGAANEVAYDPGEDILRADNDYILINGKTATGGENIGDFISSSASDRTVSTGGDMWQTSGTDPVTVDIVKGQTSVQFAEGFEFKVGPIESSKQLDYVKAEFKTNNNETVDQFTLLDSSSGTELGTFNTEEKVYVGDLSVTDVDVIVKEADYPKNGGITTVNVITW